MSSGGMLGTLGDGPYKLDFVAMMGGNPFAPKTWYIDGTNGSNGNTGLSARSAFATLAYALSVSAAGDNFVFNKGTYTISASFVPLADQTFMAGVVNERKPTVIFVSSGIADMIQIDVSGVRFSGIEFQAGDNTCDNLIDIADAADVSSCTIERCVFNGADKTSVVGIQADDATFILTNLIVRKCLFRDLTGTMIDIGVLGFAYSLIEQNQFAVDVNSGVCIALADTTAFATGKGYAIIDNIGTGFDSTGDEVMISIAGTENTTGAGIIARNYGAFLAVAMITIDKLSKSEVNNYVGDAATGGTLVDPGT